MKIFLILLALLNLVACASSNISNQPVILERSTGKNELPAWTVSSEMSWTKNEDILVKGQFTLKGNQRLNACYDLAKGEARENIVSEMGLNFQTELNSYTQGISDNENIQLNKMFLSQAKNKITGLRLSEAAYERILVNSEERINCYVVLSISKKMYQEALLNSKSEISKVNSEIIDKMKDRGLNFFSSEAQ